MFIRKERKKEEREGGREERKSVEGRQGGREGERDLIVLEIQNKDCSVTKFSFLF